MRFTWTCCCWSGCSPEVPAVVDGGGAQLLLHGDHQQHHVLPPLLLRLPLLPVLHLRQVVPHLMAAIEKVLELLLGLRVGREGGALSDRRQATASASCRWPSCHPSATAAAPTVWGLLGLLCLLWGLA